MAISEDYASYMSTFATYDEMVALATSMHPDMKVRVIDEGAGREWEFYFLPAKNVPFELPESFRGTPAWDAYEKRDSGYDTELWRWQHNLGYDMMPNEGVGEMYNFQSERGKFVRKEIERLDAITGINSFDWDEWPKDTDGSNEYFTLMRQHQAAASELADKDETLTTKYAALENKWGWAF